MKNQLSLVIFIICILLLSCQKTYLLKDEVLANSDPCYIFDINEFNIYYSANYRNIYGDNPNELLSSNENDSLANLISLNYLAISKKRDYFFYISFVPTRYMIGNEDVVSDSIPKKGFENYLDIFLSPTYKNEINVAWINEFIPGRIISDTLLDFRFRKDPKMISYSDEENSIIFGSVFNFPTNNKIKNNNTFDLSSVLNIESLTFHRMDTTILTFNHYSSSGSKMLDNIIELDLRKRKRKVWNEITFKFKTPYRNFEYLIYRERFFNERFSYTFY